VVASILLVQVAQLARRYHSGTTVLEYYSIIEHRHEKFVFATSARWTYDIQYWYKHAIIAPQLEVVVGSDDLFESVW
jgi:hypothetical protein